MTTLDIDRLLGRAVRPARYTGGEWNAVVKPWESAAVRVLLAYPDVYERGMAELAVHTLYDFLNRQPGLLCERAFAPWPDMEAAMRRQRLPLWSLESRRPAAEFDVIALVVQGELTFSNLVNMLDLAGLPSLAAQERETPPLVIASGCGVLNPEPLADFVDAFLLGDAEEVLPLILDRLRQWKSSGEKIELLRSLAAQGGVYVPGLYRPRYTAGGALAAMEPLDPAAPANPQARRLQALPAPLIRPIVPLMERVHDRAEIEIQRGYLQNHRFGETAALDRPRLERPGAEVVAAAKQLIASTGYSQLTLLALRAGEHAGLGEIARSLRAELPGHVSVSLKSMDMDPGAVEMAAVLVGSQRRSLSLAPRTGNERLRAGLGRPVTDDTIAEAAELAFAKGWTSLRLQFLIGLPGESQDDVLAIAHLSARIRELGQRYHEGRAQVRVVVSDCLARAHTPLQWSPQAPAEALRNKLEALGKALRRAGLSASLGLPEQSLLAGILARGDRRLGAVIRRAWEHGARFDGWREHFQWLRWETALAEYKIDPSLYQKERSPDETLPWSHIDMGLAEWGEARPRTRQGAKTSHTAG